MHIVCTQTSFVAQTSFGYSFMYQSNMGFFENFELQSFPFDVQYLTIAATCASDGKCTPQLRAKSRLREAHII